LPGTVTLGRKGTLSTDEHRLRPPPRWDLAWYGGALSRPTALVQQPSRARPTPPRARRARILRAFYDPRGPEPRRVSCTRPRPQGLASRVGAGIASRDAPGGFQDSIPHVKEQYYLQCEPGPCPGRQLIRPSPRRSTSSPPSTPHRGRDPSFMALIPPLGRRLFRFPLSPIPKGGLGVYPVLYPT
jgi:hypothetical protein